MTIDTKHSFISSGSCHHPESLYCKITEISKLQSVVSSPLENMSTPSHQLCPTRSQVDGFVRKLFVIVYVGLQYSLTLIFIISNSTFSLQWSLAPVYHVLIYAVTLQNRPVHNRPFKADHIHNRPCS